MSSASVYLADTQPITAEGFKAVCSVNGLSFLGMTAALPPTDCTIAGIHPTIVVIDKAFGKHAVLAWLEEVRSKWLLHAAIVWGTSMMPADIAEFIQSGASGAICKRASLAAIGACLKAVAAGRIWMDSGDGNGLPTSRVEWRDLTKKELLVLALFEDGLPLQEIATELRISKNTVRAHLENLRRKTRVFSRLPATPYGTAAFSGSRRDSLSQ